MNGFQLDKSNFPADRRCPDDPPRHPPDGNPCDDDSPVECDYFGGVIDYIKQMLMEEDESEDRAHEVQDFYALQAAERYFSDALLSVEDSSSFDDRSPDEIRSSSSGFGRQACEETLGCGDSLSNSDALLGGSPARARNSSSLTETGGICDRGCGLPGEISEVTEAISTNEDASAKRNRDRGEDDCGEERSSKQTTSCEPEQDSTERFDKLLLCTKLNPRFYDESPVCQSEEPRDDDEEAKLRSFRNSTVAKRGRPKGSKNQGKTREVIDLTNLLIRCAEAVSNLDTASAETLKQIRHHSSPYGDANERLSHCFANALEARMAGTGSSLYYASAARRLSAADFLKSYRTYVTACPFKRMSNIFANKSIGRCSRKAAKIHVIDFGIGYGFQWPCFIQGVSLRPGGPPLLKITGIDFPQPGFRPSERIDHTGRHLMNYCKRFNVPFEYKAITKNWEEVLVEDLDIEHGEFLVVNCLYGLDHVQEESSGRENVLKLIKSLNPELFVHGVINGTFNAPFFMTRFREALHHYSSFFDMVEATIPREDEDRVVYEREVLGREVMNVVACEGRERIERPETYKQWQGRNGRAGFKAVRLNGEIVREVRSKVRRGYHSYFLLDEDGEWMLQGWKGRVLYALSCWKPLPS